ncbi:hypothetical protein EDB81DRAFT_410710 [Dactylonectria macrodidyma]|uniref:C3H1-type domain-containing protein n=1 Tax=Dactylonectria macrodidyma TaxID=307937 RepID=A0A9P9JEB7_9HYPO|nr:hypothetical protein EDB81DRAFT_410710 [Dactylonectria macrodidyma]
MTAPFMDLVQRCQTLQAYQDTSGELIKDILVYAQDIETTLRDENRRLTERLRNTELDLDDATQSRRELQQRVQKYEAQMQYIVNQNDNLKNRNPYVLILIDGDGLLFQEHLIRERVEGGKKAAYALRAAVAEHVGDRADELEIVARVVANVSGLGKAMLRDGCLDNSADFKDFTLGFTQAKASFDFIDVGYGKERADSKIKETTRWHLQNHNCKQILLGISHDAGYAPFLDEILTDNASRQRVSVLEGYPTVRELKSTNVNIQRFSSDLFRQSKLVDRSAIISLPKPEPPNSAPDVLTPAASTASLSPPLAPAVTATTTPIAPAAPTAAPTTAPTPAASTSSYANVMATASPPPKMVIPLAPKPTKKASVPAPAPTWSPGPRGYDESISVGQLAMDSIKRRKEHNKLCNNHYLRGPCTKIDTCCFVHNYKPTREEIRALAMLSRLNPCTRGQDCEVEDCIYGHHCPSFRDGVCGHPYCRFPVDAHPPGTKFKNSQIRDN